MGYLGPVLHLNEHTEDAWIWKTTPDNALWYSGPTQARKK